MSNHDIDGRVPPETAAGAPGAPSGAPDTLEQQLEKEREARALMRDRLRNTEALAAESHALRARMAEELERVTADRDRLRTAAAVGTSSPIPPTPPTPRDPVASAATAAPARPGAARAVEPPFGPTAPPPRTSHAADRPLKPPPARSKGPWGALAMLSILAAAIAGVAWYKGSLPGPKEWQTAGAPTVTAPVAATNGEKASSGDPVTTAAASRPSVALGTAPASTGAVALPPLTPDAQLAAAPTAAGSTTTAAAAGMSAPEMSGRLRKALDGEGIAALVDVDAATGRVRVADPQADAAQRQRTDMVIRAVYAGASLAEPEIEHRWLSPMHGARETTASTAAPAAARTAAPVPAPPPAAVYPARPAALSREPEHRRPAEVSVADAEGLAPVLPSGRVTASCMEGLAGKSAARRANMTACMKHGCCSSAANHNSEECRAYERAYPFTCGPG